MNTLRPKKQNVWEFDLSSIGALEDLARSMSLNIPTSADFSVLAEPVPLGNITAPNSMAVQAMEGCDGDGYGRPGDLSCRRYRRFAAGGAGVCWSEAIAVVPEGKANPRQLWLNEDSKAAFAAMVKQARKAAKNSQGSGFHQVMVAQLTHSGRYAKPEGVPAPIIPQHDPYRDVMVPQFPPDAKAKKNLAADWPVATDDYLDGLQEAYVRGAKLAFEVGFDAVDIKACHGYLINEVFACFNRPGKYGGSFENRTRLLLETIARITDALGADKIVTTRFPLYDAIPYPYGWGVDKSDYRKPDMTEPKKLAQLLVDRGVKIMNTTVGNPYYSPHMGRPYNEPIIGAYEPPEHPLIGFERILRITGEMQKAVPDMALVSTGYSWLRTLLPYVGAAAKQNGLTTVVGAGRMSFAYPEWPSEIIKKGKLDPQKVCIGCSGCTQLMRDGQTAGCVVRDNVIYGPIFMHGRLSNRENLVRLADGCRECGDPTCKQACPASINIPKFIKLFLEGEEREAYEVIREANVLPEVCAWLCPVEQQCQGNCLQGFIGDASLPVADIQKYLAVQANKHGWSKVRVPAQSTGKKVAVIGGGPGGLACAAKLLEQGHSVTIFDGNKELGGMVECTIPREKHRTSLSNEVTAIFKDVPGDRLRLELGRPLDADFNLDKVMAQGFDSAFLGMGLWESKTLCRNSKPAGLWGALEFLTAIKQGEDVDLAGKRVAVIGGGNTGMDTAHEAKKLGAAAVYMICFESFVTMPAWYNERTAALRDDISFMNLFMPKEYVSKNGKVTGVKMTHVRLAEADENGFCAPIEIPGSTLSIDVDVVVESLGQKAPDNLADILPGVELTEKRLVAVKAGSQATSRAGVYAGGDVINGGLTVVRAVADGTAAAAEIDCYLQSDADRE